MSVQDALRFIAAVREDPELVSRVEKLGPGATIDRLVGIGGERGMSFTAEELRKAYKHDWAMRLARYAPPERPE